MAGDGEVKERKRECGIAIESFKDKLLPNQCKI